MKLSEVKSILENAESLSFQLPDGKHVPEHFHVTEVGSISKKFIDCGGTLRVEKLIAFQLWNADDYDHRLHPEKLLSIIQLSERQLHLGNHEIEVEFQGETIEKYALDYDGEQFLLTAKQTDCLAIDACGIPESKPRVKLSELQAANSCAPGSGCC